MLLYSGKGDYNSRLCVTQESCNKSETTEVESSQEITGQVSKSSLVDSSHPASSSASPSVTERIHHDDTTVITDCSQSGDDISTGTTGMMMVPNWRCGKGHKRSRSSTMDYRCLTSEVTVRHKRNSSLDINLFEYKKIDNPTVTDEVENSLPLPVVQDNAQEEWQQQQQQQEEEEQVTTSDPLEDEVDFSSMFGKWKGKPCWS